MVMELGEHFFQNNYMKLPVDIPTFVEEKEILKKIWL